MIHNNSRPGGTRLSQPFRAADIRSAIAEEEVRSLDAKLPEHVEGELLVKLKPGMSFAGLNSFASDYGATVAERIKMPRTMQLAFQGDLLRVALPEGMSAAEGMLAMRQDARVAYAETNNRIQVPETHASEVSLPPARPSQPTDEGPQLLPQDLSTKLWGLHNSGQNGGTLDADIDAPEAWAVTTGSRKNTIAVIDTGSDYNHKALAGNIWTNPKDGTHGFNAIDGSHDPMDDHYHGTHVAGSIAGNGTDGVYGVNHQASLMPIKFLSAEGGGTLADAIKGIVFATENGARITSNSWGGGPFNQALRDAFAASPALHIIAAGNESNDNDASPTYPGSYDLPNVVSVAASDRNDQLASFSNYGASSVDLSGPGVSIYSTAPGNKYRSLDGTSMATPYVSGVAGLILAQYPDISNEELKARLLNSVDDVPGFVGKMSTAGRVNAARALAPDSAPPGAPTEFRVVEAEAGKVTLGWLAAGDDGPEGGQAANYLVRYSDRPIVDGTPGPGQISFEEATLVQVARPQEPGTSESLSLELPLEGREKNYYFAIKSGDKVGKTSELATTQTLIPAAEVAFEDDGAVANFSGDGWSQIEVAGKGKVWTDSADGEYANNANTAITSKSISLASLKGSKLKFEATYSTENRYDNVALEVTSDGNSWKREANYTGTSDWKSHTIDLSRYDGQEIQFRFRLTSDSSAVADGFTFGRVLVAGSKQ